LLFDALIQLQIGLNLLAMIAGQRRLV
jgi:hypothetical protein